MNKYTKPTLSLLAVATNGGSTSSCATGTDEAKELMAFLKDMGLQDSSFNSSEGCDTPADMFDPSFSSYCKFSGAIQVFYS